MKKSILLLLAISFAVMSCETDVTVHEEGQNANFLLEKTHHMDGNPYMKGESGNTDPVALEQSMQWASFVIAKVLYDDETHRENVSNYLYLQQGLKTMPLEAFLGPNPAIPNFKADFTSYFDNVTACLSEPIPGFTCPGSSGSPGEPACPPCNGVTGTGSGELLISYLLNENCIELYFPRGTQYHSILTTVSTAHPMTIAAANFGYKRTGPTTTTNVAQVKVNYINTNNFTFIVLRPKRYLEHPECLYDDINVVDFTDFLDGQW